MQGGAMSSVSVSRGLTRITGAVAFTVLVLVLFLLGVSRATAGTTTNPWLQDRFLNIAHQGGESEAPSNTMYAFKSAMTERGADMLELDVQLTQDGVLV